MKAILRALAILIDPVAAWERIEKEPADPAYLMFSYAAPLALIPAVCGFLGASVIGVVEPAGNARYASIFEAVFGTIFGYLETLAVVALLGLVINFAAPLFGGRTDFARALKLAVYSYTPVWLSGIFLLLPGLRFLMLAGLYGAYILAAGLPHLMRLPRQKIAGFALLIVATACALTVLAASAQRALFGIPLL
jgi:hypothetical protein